MNYNGRSQPILDLEGLYWRVAVLAIALAITFSLLKRWLARSRRTLVLNSTGIQTDIIVVDIETANATFEARYRASEPPEPPSRQRRTQSRRMYSPRSYFPFYAVAVGRRVGVFRSWPTVEPLVTGFVGARYRGFFTEAEAHFWITTLVPGYIF